MDRYDVRFYCALLLVVFSIVSGVTGDLGCPNTSQSFYALSWIAFAAVLCSFVFWSDDDETGG